MYKLVDCFFKELVHEGLYDNTDYLQIECFKFRLFPLIQKELDGVKNYRNNHPIRQSAQLDRELRPEGRPDVLYVFRDSSSEYTLKYDNQDILLVG